MQLGCASTGWWRGAVSARSLAWLAIGGIGAYVAIDVLLKFLRPEYSLIYNAESDYGRGPWYWVMDLNFLLRCALSLVAGVAVGRVPCRGALVRGGMFVLAAWAVCSGLLALVADDVEGTPLTVSGIVHLALAFIAFSCVTIGAILTSGGLRSDPAWKSAGNVLLAVALACGAAFMLLIGAARHQHAPGGLYERIFLGLELAWIALAAGYAVRRPGQRAPGPVVISSASPRAHG